MGEPRACPLGGARGGTCGHAGDTRHSQELPILSWGRDRAGPKSRALPPVYLGSVTWMFGHREVMVHWPLWVQGFFGLFFT